MSKTFYYHGSPEVASRGTGVNMVRKILSIIAVMILAFSTLVATNARQAKAMDNWVVNTFVCGNDLGLNTAWNPAMNFTSPNPTEESGYNKLTLQDVYGDRLSWTTYNGTRQPGKIAKDKGNLLGAATTADSNGVSGRLDNTIKDASSSTHDFLCPVKSLTSMMAGTILGTAGAISNFTSLFVTLAVDPNFICQDPANPQGMCINLLGVIAGTGGTSGSGIISRLYNGLYSGLCVLAFAGVGLWAAWNGLAKRKLMSALGGIAWAIGIFGIGVVFMSSPLFLAKLPMQIGTTLGGCVVMGVNGQNCMSVNSGNHGDNTANTECYVDENGTLSATRAMALSAKMASCKVWKAFVFEPWVAGQFGTSYDQLFTGGDSNPAGALFTNSATKDNLDYWKNIKVGLYTSNQKMNNICKDTSQDSSYAYSNLALYQLNLMSDPALHACGVAYHRTTGISTDQGVYGDWIWLIDAMSQAWTTKDKTGADNLSIMWASWAGNNYMGRFSVAFIALFSSFFGAAVLITTAVLAMVYLFMSVLLTAFAPLFFLLGIMPGQGKKLFLGWVEKIVSNTLKYFGCILWMMVTLELYAAVLGNANTSLGLTMIFTIIVTLAMWLYRGEFLKMIGKANLGGTQFSNAIGDWAKKKGNSVKDTAVVTAGATLGAALAGRSAPKVKEGDIDPETGIEYTKETAKQFNKSHSRKANMRNAAGMQLTQSLKTKGGIIGTAAQANDRIRDRRRKDNRATIKSAHDKNVQALNRMREKLINEGWDAATISSILNASHGDPTEFEKAMHMFDTTGSDALLRSKFGVTAAQVPGQKNRAEATRLHTELTTAGRDVIQKERIVDAYTDTSTNFGQKMANIQNLQRLMDDLGKTDDHGNAVVSASTLSSYGFTEASLMRELAQHHVTGGASAVMAKIKANDSTVGGALGRVVNREKLEAAAAYNADARSIHTSGFTDLTNGGRTSVTFQDIQDQMNADMEARDASKAKYDEVNNAYRDASLRVANDAKAHEGMVAAIYQSRQVEESRAAFQDAESHRDSGMSSGKASMRAAALDNAAKMNMDIDENGEYHVSADRILDNHGYGHKTLRDRTAAFGGSTRHTDSSGNTVVDQSDYITPAEAASGTVGYDTDSRWS